MRTSAFDLVRLLPEVERVSGLKTIPSEQKAAILHELLVAVPDPVFCGLSLKTRDYVIETIQGALDGCATTATKKIPTKEGKRASPAKSAEAELLRNSDGDGGRSSTTATVVNKAPQKRGKAKRSA